MFKYILLVIVLLFLTGCGEEEKAKDVTEYFAGELTISRVEEVFERTDFVNLTIYGRSYDLKHIDNESNLCDSYGTQSGFGTNKLNLIPDTSFFDTNCDKNRIPKGEFRAIFDGANLELGPKIETLYIAIDENNIRREIWSYHFILTQQ